jgi:hypothetical protein
MAAMRLKKIQDEAKMSRRPSEKCCQMAMNSGRDRVKVVGSRKEVMVITERGRGRVATVSCGGAWREPGVSLGGVEGMRFIVYMRVEGTPKR